MLVLNLSIKKLSFPVFFLFLFQGSLWGQSRIVAVQSNIVEPYPFLSGKFSGSQIKESPDPLVGYKWGETTADDDLEIYALHPKSISSNGVRSFQSGKDAGFPLKINGACDLRFDFGIESAGWLEFDSDDLDEEIQMSISEYNEPAILNEGAHHPEKTMAPVRHGSTYRLELNDEFYEGVRFGWIHIKSLKKPFTIKEVRLVCQVKPTNYRGSFSCSNPMLTKIWYTGAYTVKLNLQKDFFGAILMERSDRYSWTGDAYPSQAASMVAFGNYDFVRKNLFHTSTQSNSIASYPIYWILSLVDYCNYTGDKATLNELLQNACQKLDSAYTHFDQTTGLAFNGWDERLGAGFENPGCTESRYVYQTLTIEAWNKFSKLMTWLGQNDLSKKYMQFAIEKTAQLRRSENCIQRFGIHAASNFINSEVVLALEKKMLWRNSFNDRQQRLSYSPFNQFFIIQAMARMGKYEEALSTIDDCWGGQIRYGGTTFFEVYRPSWNTGIGTNGAPVNNQCGYTSLAHPWSAGITKWLSEEILGIKPTTPGFETFEVRPNLTSEIDWVKGEVPTLHGIISISFDKLKGEMNLSVPENTTANVAIPKLGIVSYTILVNRKSFAPELNDQNFYRLKGLASGSYTIKFQPLTKVAILPKEPFPYLYQPATEDSLTHGNWKSKFGSKGFVLFNFDSINKHDKKLPDFISDITLRLNGDVHLAVETDDPRALELISGNEGHRKLGAIITKDPAPCLQTMTIDIQCKQNQSYQLSLYMVDWEKEGRRSAIEVFDLKNKNLLMPVYLVRNYQNGKYIVLKVDRSVRIRINQVRGSNAALSALFID